MVSKFCPGCGAPMAQGPAMSAQPAQAAQPARPAVPPQAATRSRPVAPPRPGAFIPPPAADLSKPAKSRARKPPHASAYTPPPPTQQQPYSANESSEQQPGDGGEQKPERKITRIVSQYEPGKTSFFGTIYHFIFDPEKFYSRADMNQELGKALGIFVLVNVCRGVGQIGTKYLMFNHFDAKELDGVLISSLVGCLYPVTLSIFGMIIMTLLYKQFASWKRIFGIYAFASVPYLLSLLPIPLINIACFGLFVYYAKMGFENVFGLDSTSAYLFALGLPILYWICVFLVIVSGLGLAMSTAM